MERLHAVIKGRVQGVNFRATTLRRATNLGITGWVTNNMDGTVEVVAEGERSELEELLNFLRIGPPAAQVSDIDTQWRPAQNSFQDFTIR